MLKTKDQDLNIAPSEKWNVCVSLPLQNLLSSNDRLPLWNITKKMLMGVLNNNMIEQFKILYMYYPSLYHNKAFKYQV